jgi:hypothetical protein
MLLASVYDDYTNGGVAGANDEIKEEQNGSVDFPVETIEDGL